MLTPSRSLALNVDTGRELPHIAELRDLYAKGVKFRQGEVMMIAGRSGSQKSGLALWLCAKWNLPTLYFSADMAPPAMSSRLASMFFGLTGEQVEQQMASTSGSRAIFDTLNRSRLQFASGGLDWPCVYEELEAYTENWDAWPSIIVFDNLMDFDGAEADYAVQMQVMGNAAALSRETGSTVIILHHASDKNWDAKNNPFEPPSRDQVKGGLSEKPRLSLSVALDPTDDSFRVACIKQSMGPSDPTARNYAVLKAQPELTRFWPRDVDWLLLDHPEAW